VPPVLHLCPLALRITDVSWCVLVRAQGWREIIRFIPPLTITQAEMDTALAMLERGFTKAVATWKGPAPGYARKV